MSDEIHVKLSQAEALMIFEALATLDEKKLLDGHVSQEERTACWRLEGILEKELPVFAPNYAELVEHAKRSIRGGESIQSPVPTREKGP